jgi:WD40 repeat protein
MKGSAYEFDSLLRFQTLSPDARFAVLQGEGAKAVFELASGKKLFTMDRRGGFRFSRDGSVLVSYNGYQVCIWAIPSGELMKRFTFPSSFAPSGYGYLDCLSLSPNSKVLAVGGFTEPHIVGLISLVSGDVLDKFECCPTSMCCDAIEFSWDGRILATDTDAVDRTDKSVKPLLRFWKLPDSW